MRTIIDSNICELAKQTLSKLGKIGTVSKKLQAVISAHKHGIKKVSEVMNVSKASIYLWSKQLENGDFEGLINKSKHQDGIKIKTQHKESIKSWLKETPTLTIKEVRILLKEKYNIDVSKSTVHRAMQASGFAYITGRKKHYKQNKEEELRKNGKKRKKPKITLIDGGKKFETTLQT